MAGSYHSRKEGKKTMIIRSSSQSAGLVTFLTGFVLGAGAGLLLAPQSGVRTRRHLQHVGHQLRDKAEDLTQEAKHLFGSVLNRTGM